MYCGLRQIIKKGNFLLKLVGLIGTVSHDATIAILTLLMENGGYIDECSPSPVFDLLKSSDDTLRLAAFHFIKEIGTSLRVALVWRARGSA